LTPPVTLTVLMGGVRPTPVPQTVIEALTVVLVTSSATGQSGFQLQLTLGKDSVVARHLLPSGFFDPRTRVIIVATVRGTPHVLMDGVITKHDVVPSNTAGESTLSVTGLDLSALMDFVDLSGFPYPAMPPNVIVTLILAKYALFGVIPLVVPSVVALIENPLERIRSQRGTDLSFISQLGGAVGHVFYIDPGPAVGISTAYWGPEVRMGASQPALTINMDGVSNVESLSFSYDGLRRRQLLATIVEPNSKIPIPIPIPDIGVLKPPLAKERATTLKTQNLGEVAKLNAAQAVMLALSGVAGNSDAITANGQLDVMRYGHVLRARQLVAVRGAGTYYDGLYYTQQVTHTLRSGEYTQGFSLVRGGIRSTISQVSA
jgi:hypothetical protein